MPPTMRLVIAFSTILLGSACIHDWDSLEAPEGSGGGADGGGGSGTGTGSGAQATCPGEDPSVEALCAVYCEQINSCVTSDPNCVSDCESAMAGCPPGALQQIRECMDSIDTCNCAGVCGLGSTLEAGLAVCVATTVGCWDPPHDCP